MEICPPELGNCRERSAVRAGRARRAQTPTQVGSRRTRAPRAACSLLLGGQVFRDLDGIPQSIPRSPGHQRNFFDSIKTRRLSESNLPYVVRMTAPMFFGRISLLLGGRKLTWDAARHCFEGDPEATRLLGRVNREPWTLPV